MKLSRWKKLSLIEQMANIGSEVYRTIKWRSNSDFAEKAFYRALELFDLTIEDKKNKKRLKEVIRARELFADYIIGDNQYKSSDKQWQKYFYNFNYAARIANL
ncbi:MAG: hypothetical protein ABIG90_03060 [bacterium]